MSFRGVVWFLMFVICMFVGVGWGVVFLDLAAG